MILYFCFVLEFAINTGEYKTANKWPYNKNILLSILQKIATNKDIRLQELVTFFQNFGWYIFGWVIEL